MIINSINNKYFLKYGKVIKNINTENIIRTFKNNTFDGSGYIASYDKFENIESRNDFENFFGQIKIQIGICYGNNIAMNALEWHKSSEINVALTDCILLLGKFNDFKDNVYESKKLQAFYLKKGDCIEINPYTMHFCPIAVNQKFATMVVLPFGTNTELENNSADKLLYRKNKWLICHENNQNLISKGVMPFIIGKNYKLKRKNNEICIGY